MFYPYHDGDTMFLLKHFSLNVLAKKIYLSCNTGITCGPVHEPQTVKVVFKQLQQFRELLANF